MVTSMCSDNFSLFFPFEIVLDLDRIEPSVKALVFHPDGNRYAIVLFEGQPSRLFKSVSSSYLHLVWVKASDFSRCSRHPADFPSSRPLVRKMGETDCNG